MSKQKFFNRYFFLLIALMTGIFIFSHMPGEESSKQSGLIVFLLEYMGLSVTKENLHRITFIVRKGAHMSEYFILTIVCIRYYRSICAEKITFLAFITSFLYACSDEFHQTFIPGRAGQFTDVLVDSGGIVIALICYIIWKKLKKPVPSGKIFKL